MLARYCADRKNVGKLIRHSDKTWISISTLTLSIPCKRTCEVALLWPRPKWDHTLWLGWFCTHLCMQFDYISGNEFPASDLMSVRMLYVQKLTHQWPFGQTHVVWGYTGFHPWSLLIAAGVQTHAVLQLGNKFDGVIIQSCQINSVCLHPQ